MKRIDKIRQMSSEELANKLFIMIECCNITGSDEYDCDVCPLSGALCGSVDGIMEWLEAEVKEDA